MQIGANIALLFNNSSNKHQYLVHNKLKKTTNGSLKIVSVSFGVHCNCDSLYHLQDFSVKIAIRLYIHT